MLNCTKVWQVVEGEKKQCRVLKKQTSTAKKYPALSSSQQMIYKNRVFFCSRRHRRQIFFMIGCRLPPVDLRGLPPVGFRCFAAGAAGWTLLLAGFIAKTKKHGYKIFCQSCHRLNCATVMPTFDCYTLPPIDLCILPPVCRLQKQQTLVKSPAGKLLFKAYI